MTMGMKVHQIVDEEDLQKKAKERKKESDDILESVYSMLMGKKGESS